MRIESNDGLPSRSVVDMVTLRTRHPARHSDDDELVNERTVHSISELIEERRSREVEGFRQRALSLRGQDSQTLIARLETTTDPLLIWAVHLELDARLIPPALRWPGNDADEQALFVTWCADLYWFCKRHPSHRPRFKGWQGLFKSQCASATWHATAHRQFLFVRARNSLSHWCSKGLDLSDADRAPMMTMPTKRMQADRRALDRPNFADLERLVLDHAIKRPDKARQCAPHEVALRRASMWRVFVLSGRSATVAASHWTALTGIHISRQAFSKQIEIVGHLLRLRNRGVVS